MLHVYYIETVWLLLVVNDRFYCLLDVSGNNTIIY